MNEIKVGKVCEHHEQYQEEYKSPFNNEIDEHDEEELVSLDENREENYTKRIETKIMNVLFNNTIVENDEE